MGLIRLIVAFVTRVFDGDDRAKECLEWSLPNNLHHRYIHIFREFKQEDSDSNGNGKTATLHVHHALVHFFVVTAGLRRENA